MLKLIQFEVIVQNDQLHEILNFFQYLRAVIPFKELWVHDKMRTASYEAPAVSYQSENPGVTLTQSKLTDLSTEEDYEDNSRPRGKCARLVLGVSSLYIYAVSMVVNYMGAQGHSKLKIIRINFIGLENHK